MNRAQRRAALAATGGWGVWERGTYLQPSRETLVAFAQANGLSIEAAMGEYLKAAESEVWLNGIYQVAVRRFHEPGKAATVWLSIKRKDRGPVGVERFRHFQRIKNELVGPECEAVELYPAESRLVDTANQWHLWVFADPKYRLPFGYTERLVRTESSAGAVQRPFGPDEIPGGEGGAA